MKQFFKDLFSNERGMTWASWSLIIMGLTTLTGILEHWKDGFYIWNQWLITYMWVWIAYLMQARYEAKIRIMNRMIELMQEIARIKDAIDKQESTNNKN